MRPKSEYQLIWESYSDNVGAAVFPRMDVVEAFHPKLEGSDIGFTFETMFRGEKSYFTVTWDLSIDYEPADPHSGIEAGNMIEDTHLVDIKLDDQSLRNDSDMEQHFIKWGDDNLRGEYVEELEHRYKADLIPED